jgi:hypothetical protein
VFIAHLVTCVTDVGKETGGGIKVRGWEWRVEVRD